MLHKNLTCKGNWLKWLKTKLNMPNGLLAKMRHFISKNHLRTIYFAIFNSHLWYCNQIWGQKDPQEIITIIILQNKELWILTFKVPTEHSTPLYKNKEIIKNNIHNKGYKHLFCISTNKQYPTKHFCKVLSIKKARTKSLLQKKKR